MYRIIRSLASLLILYFLPACGSNETNKSDISSSVISFEGLTATSYLPEDGIYTAIEDYFNDEGWKNTISFEVSNFEIINISFNAINDSAASTKKDLSAKGVYTLDNEDQSDILSWDKQIELLESYVLYHQDIDSIHVLDDGTTDSIPRLTLNIQPFLNLLGQAFEVGPIELGPYMDGYYFAEQEEFINGFKYFVRLIVENGYIIAVHWNGMNEDGVRLLTDYNIEEKEETWREQVEYLEKFLIDIQDPMEVTFDDDNKTQHIFGVSIEVSDFIELAVKALANGPLLIEDN